MRQSVVSYSGDPDGMGPIFNMSFDCPLARYPESYPTDRQRDAINAFYGFEVQEESECQVHALLSYRDYARFVTEVVYRSAPPASRLLIARAIAAFVSQDVIIRRDVARWADRRWREGLDEGTAVRSIQRTKHFERVAAFAGDMLQDMRDAGVSIVV